MRRLYQMRKVINEDSLYKYKRLGGGGRVKKEKIRLLIREEDADFMAIQVTKIVEVDRFFCESLWGDQDVNWANVPSEGNSGGIISLWKNSLFSLIYTFSGKGFLGIFGIWIKTSTPCIVINIYSSCILAENKQLWADLITSKMGFGGYLWCIVRDFNALKRSSERRGINQQ